MNSIRKFIFDSIEDNDNLTLDAAAKAIGISSKALRDFKSGAKSLTFPRFLKLAFLLDKRHPHETLSQWCLQFDTTDTIRNAFEYAAITRNVALLEELIVLHRDSSGKVKECVAVYGFVLRMVKHEINHADMPAEIRKIKNVKDSSMLLLLEIYRIIAAYHAKDFLMIPNMARAVEEEIAEMSENTHAFFKFTFSNRLAEILAHTHLYLNNITLARRYAQILIDGNINIKLRADAFSIIGFTYLRENGTKAIEYLTQSYETMKLTGESKLVGDSLYNLHYAQLYIGIKLPADADVALRAFESYKNGEVMGEAVREAILNSGDADLIEQFEAISGDEAILITKYQALVARANMFNAAIIIGELTKREEVSLFVQSLALVNLNLNNKGDVLIEKSNICNFDRCYLNCVA